MTDKGAITDFNATLVLEMTPRIYKHILAKDGIFAEVSIKWWEHTETSIYLFSCQFTHDFNDFFRSMVAIVEIYGYSYGFLIQVISELSNLITFFTCFISIDNILSSYFH